MVTCNNKTTQQCIGSFLCNLYHVALAAWQNCEVLDVVHMTHQHLQILMHVFDMRIGVGA